MYPTQLLKKTSHLKKHVEKIFIISYNVNMLSLKKIMKRQHGFTLVEIMIVVTIIGILASLAVPAFQRARWKALETSIRNNLRQIWGAAQQYMLENGVDKVDTSTIVGWVKKGASEIQGKDEGFTSVIQQVSDEEYDKIGYYTTDNISNYTSDEKTDDGISTFGTEVSENTQGLIIKVGGTTNTRYVKLRI